MSSPFTGADDEGRTARLLILTARALEYNDLMNQYDSEKLLHQNHPYYHLDSSFGDVRITHTGMGREESSSTLRKLAGSLDPDLILVTGTAGALKPDFQRGDLFLASAVNDSRRNGWLHPPTDLMKWILGTLESDSDDYNLRSGPLFSAENPVIEPDARHELHESHGALAVDMETSTIIDHFLSDSSETIPWGVLRVISDTFEDQSFEEIKNHQEEASRKVSTVLETILDKINSGAGTNL
jgi:nucleoside phosphorylase